MVIAEALGGSEEEFAKAMTRKARALGMTPHASTRTRPACRTTIRSPPRATRPCSRWRSRTATRNITGISRPAAFAWRGVSIRNHNRLLGKVEGVDGIKTGYTRASGFNLVTSVKRGNRHLVAVVLGGRSGGARDARMRELIEAHVDEGATNRTAPRVAEAPEAAGSPAESRASPRAEKAARAASPKDEPRRRSRTRKQDAPKQDSVTTAAIPPARPAPAPGSTDPIKPNLVKTLTVKASASQTASLAPVSLLSPMPVTSQTHAALGARSEPELPPPPPGAKPGVLGVLSTQAVAAPAPSRRSPHRVAAPAAPKPQPVYASASAPAAISAAAPIPAAQLPRPDRARHFIRKQAAQRLDRSGRRLSKTSPKRARS